jgi:glutathione S-transferase
MKLYTYDPAPNPKRLTLFMNYKGIDIETQQIDMMAAEQLGDDYRQINPDCTVPALVLDDGAVLTEVIGICAYLEGLHPEKPLMGSTLLEKAQVISWDHKLFNIAFMPIAEMLRNGSPNFADRALPGPQNVAQIPELAERGKLRLDHAWTVLDAAVAGKPWLAGDNFSLADIDMVVTAEFSGWVKATPPESCSNLHAYLERAKAELV